MLFEGNRYLFLNFCFKICFLKYVDSWALKSPFKIILVELSCALCKAPAKKTIDELNQLDAEDESLRKYKEVSNRLLIYQCNLVRTMILAHIVEYLF